MGKREREREGERWWTWVGRIYSLGRRIGSMSSSVHRGPWPRFIQSRDPISIPISIRESQSLKLALTCSSPFFILSRRRIRLFPSSSSSYPRRKFFTFPEIGVAAFVIFRGRGKRVWASINRKKYLVDSHPRRTKRRGGGGIKRRSWSGADNVSRSGVR